MLTALSCPKQKKNQSNNYIICLHTHKNGAAVLSNIFILSYYIIAYVSNLYLYLMAKFTT